MEMNPSVFNISSRGYKLDPDSLKVSWFSQGVPLSYSDTTYYRFRFTNKDGIKLFDTVFMYSQRNDKDYLLTYQYNNAKKRTKIEFFQKENNQWSFYGSETYGYDSHNNEVKYSCSVPQYVFQDSVANFYNSTGNIIERIEYKYNFQNIWEITRHLDSIQYDSENKIISYVERFEDNPYYKYSDIKWSFYNPDYIFYKLDPKIDFDYVHINSYENYFNYRDPNKSYLSSPTDFNRFVKNTMNSDYRLDRIKKTTFNDNKIIQTTKNIYSSGHINLDSLDILTNQYGSITLINNYRNGEYSDSRSFTFDEDNIVVQDSSSNGQVFDMTYLIDDHDILHMYEIDLHKYGVQDDKTKYEFYYSDILQYKPVPEKQKIRIFPNPAIDQIFIDASGSIAVSDWSISDISSRSVMSGKINNANEVINLRSISPGIYFLRIGNGSYLQTIKILKM